MSNRNELTNLNRNYVTRHSRRLRLNLRNGQGHFNNCLAFRLKLYNLREPLLSFIERKFHEFIETHRLRNNNKWGLLEKIKDQVRTNLFGLNQPAIISLREEGAHRKLVIDGLIRVQVNVNWKTLASIYTGNFLLRKNVFNVEEISDPKDLLEVLKNCSLFPEELYDPATLVIRARNKYYAHLPELFIRTNLLLVLETSIKEFEDLLTINYNL